ncbi:MAG TPA: hypothetical protein VFY46_01070, partial [Acidimicrobiia bacterium]|nr:hypothetical protein [Acidimicrobiia bacterium]
QTGFWNDSRRWLTYESLSSAAFGLVGDSYFFGFVANMPLAMSVNGESRIIDGPGIVVVQISEAIDIGHASPQIVATSPDSSLQGDGFVGQWLTGEWALLEFTVPVDREIMLSHRAEMFGPAPSVFEAWDWTQGAFESIEPGELEHQRFVNSEGAVLMRLQLGADNEFFGGFPIGSISLTWDPGAP